MKKILIIEDNPDLRENTEELLQLANYEVFTAENGRAGVKLAFECMPDLILCDIMMPELDGFGVLRILSKDSRTKYVPFLFLTAKTELSDIRKGMSLGADDYLTKPFEEIDLLDSIETRLQRAAETRSTIQQEGFFSDDLGKQKLQEFIEQYELVPAKKKQALFQEGSHAHFCLFLKSGVVKTIQTNDFGRELTLHLRGADNFLGLKDVIMAQPYQETAIALSDCSFYRIPAKEFRETLNQDINMFRTVSQTNCKMLESARSRGLSIAFDSVRKRTALGLLAFQQVYQESEEMTIVREDLASYCASTKESVIRTLSDFKNEGLIGIKQNKIRLLKKNDLADIYG